MKLVYTHESKILVDSVRLLLEENGISTTLRNEFSSSAVGELSPIDTWPEVWVDEHSYLRATKVIDAMNSQIEERAWRCSGCGEENEATFEICWNCLKERVE
ncbi:putative signal transducing protein [Vibrio viridaestus]|uniref:DUF2007 domain-containing protein n=1 Tax=Vibrio viridaestus TaxID=2487322 RepID=A0A3N9TIX5_9VIBR|nr:DUF2007 domain-containing protein [Vibrio viridaestus]RQW64060.1 DUF2007 domain-containing protein [Vibrio viridaestus]